MKKNYLVLVSASKEDAATLRKIGANMQSIFNSAPLWFDSTHAGFFVATDKKAREIYGSTITDLPRSAMDSMRDLVVLELGEDHQTRDKDTKVSAWLNAHRRSDAAK